MPCTIPPPSAPQEALCTGKGAAARRERAVEAGWLELLISACSAAIEGGEGDEGGGGGGGGQGEERMVVVWRAESSARLLWAWRGQHCAR